MGRSHSVDAPSKVITAVGLAAVIIAGTVASFHLDDAVQSWVRARSPSTRNFAGNVCNYGQWHYLMLVAGAIGFFAWQKGHRSLLRIIVAMIIAATAAGLAADAVRWTTGRTRPNAPVPQGWYGVSDESRWLFGQYHYSSFPSAHTATITGYVGVLLFANRRRGAVFLLLAVLMGWARIVVDAHHLSDVWVAGVLGMGVAYWTWHSLLPRSSWLKRLTG